jgi:hypothetical protein
MRFLLQGFGILVWMVSPSFARDLAFPDERHSLETLESHIRVVYPHKEEALYSISWDGRRLFKTPIEKGQPLRNLLKHQRIYFPKDRSLHGLYPLPDRLWFAWNGAELGISIFNPDFSEEISYRTIIWDRIAPADDPRGVATSIETQIFRKKIKEEFSLTNQMILGLAPLSPETYILGSSLPSAPVMIMKCDPKELNLCEITRGCSLQSPGFDFSKNSSMTYDKETQTIYFLQGHEIYSFFFQSCYHVPQNDEVIKLDPKIKKPSGIFWDSQDNRLWVSSEIKDDYHNGSVFYFDLSSGMEASPAQPSVGGKDVPVQSKESKDL